MIKQMLDILHKASNSSYLNLAQTILNSFIKYIISTSYTFSM